MEGPLDLGRKRTSVRRLSWRLFDDNMRVGAGKSERADAGDARVVAGEPRARGPRQLEGKLAPRDVRARLAERRMRRNRFVLEGQHHFDEPGDAGGRLEVPDVRLRRAEKERTFARARGA